MIIIVQVNLDLELWSKYSANLIYIEWLSASIGSFKFEYAGNMQPQSFCSLVRLISNRNVIALWENDEGSNVG